MEQISKKIRVMREMAFQSANLGAKTILNDFFHYIEQNQVSISECYDIDNEISLKNDSLDIKRMLDIIDFVNKYEISDTRIYTLLNERQIIKYKQSKGVLGAIYNGDIYITIELIAKVLKTGNALILNIGLNNNIGTNNLLVKAINEILEKNNKPKGLIEINFTEKNNLICEELDGLIIIGDKELQLEYNSNYNDIIRSGYGYCEIYIDDLNNEAYIKEIIKNSEFNLKVYINSNLQTEIKGKKVKGLEEAIEYINKQGSRFASTIFSDNTSCQKVFLKRCKSKHIFINADPNIAEDSDLQIEDFYYNKIGMV